MYYMRVIVSDFIYACKARDLLGLEDFILVDKTGLGYNHLLINVISLKVAELSVNTMFTKWLYFYIAAGVFLMFSFTIFIFLICRTEKKTKNFLAFNQLSYVLDLLLTMDIESKQDYDTDLMSIETKIRLMDYIDKFEAEHGYKDPLISLTSLSTSFGTNRSYLSAILKERNNENFNTYINRLRVEYVLKLLRSEDDLKFCKVAYISSLAGFSSHSQFSTVFKRVKGVTFTMYIKENSF